MATSEDGAQKIIQLFDARLNQYRNIVNEFADDKLWQRPQPGMVSLGNLVCHIAGAMRDWFENGIGQGQWTRDRQFEFDRDGGMICQELLDHFNRERIHCDHFLRTISTENWHEERRFRNDTFTIYDMLLRQLEHVNYHAGQAAFLRRIVAELGPVS